MNRVLLGLFLTLCLADCSGLRSPNRERTRLPPTPTNTTLQDDYAIYTELLPIPPVADVRYAIQQTTTSAPFYNGLALPAGQLVDLQAETLSDFNAANRQNHPLAAVFTGPDPHLP